MKIRYGPDNPGETYVPHAYPEHAIDLGEVVMNYATTGSPDKPALLLIPAQTESWWGYEKVMPLLEHAFQVFAVDLRGQGRSTRTPGRYTLDNWGNDLVRFIDLAIGRPTVVAGLSSGGVLSAWLAAFAKPGQVRGALCEDPPLFGSEFAPACGHSMRQGAGPLFAHYAKYLGDQWSIGDWEGLQASAPNELPHWMAAMLQARGGALSQNLKEYDPEWGRAFSTGSASAGCDHARMLSNVKVPVLMTHHFHKESGETGEVVGAMSDLQARRVRELIEAAGQHCDYRSFPAIGHFMHVEDPPLYAKTLTDWAATL